MEQAKSSAESAKYASAMYYQRVAEGVGMPGALNQPTTYGSFVKAFGDRLQQTLRQQLDTAVREAEGRQGEGAFLRGPLDRLQGL